MKKVFAKHYLYWFIIITFSYIILAVIISEFYINFKYIPYYLGTIKWQWFIASIVFTLVIGMLVGLNAIYAYIKHKENKVFRREAAFSCAGTIGGLSAGVCPSCAAGLFPFVLDSFGVSFSYLSLPFKGLEIQFFSIVLLSISLYFLYRGAE